jgi:hypothetical protein
MHVDRITLLSWRYPLQWTDGAILDYIDGL